MVPPSEQLAPARPQGVPFPRAAATSAHAGLAADERAEIRAVVAAAVRLYRDGIALGLGQEGVQVVAHASDAHETLAAVAASPPDVVLLEISMEGAHDIVRALVELAPRAKVVAFAVDDAHDDEVLACAEMGVAGWVGRDGSLVQLLEAIRCAARGELMCSARASALMARRLASLAGDRQCIPTGPQLTPREAEVAELLSRGVSNKHIARVLSLRLATVKNHVHRILNKLDVRTRAEAGARLREVHEDQAHKENRSRAPVDSPGI
jgi:two-component system, NarL family, nitrate/nitrite response regulator NarL